MKFLFKLFIGFLIFIGLILFAFHKSAIVPVDDYDTGGTQINITDMVSEQVDVFLDDSTKPLHVGFQQSMANNLIRNTLIDQMGNNSSTNAYILKDNYYGFQGVWTTFDASKVTIESGVHLFIGPITYKTRLMLAFSITESEGVIVLKLDKFNIGKIPFAWMAGPAASIYKAIMKQDINTLVNDALGNIGTFDIKTRTMTVDLRDAINEQVSDPNQKEVLEAVLNIVYANELIQLKAADESFGIDLNLNKLANNNVVNKLNAAERIQNQQEFEQMFHAKMPGAFVGLLSSNDLVIKFDELDTNKLIDYLLHQDDLSKTTLVDVPIVEGYNVTVETPYITLNNTSLSIAIPFLIQNDDSTKQFKSIIEIETTLSVVGKDLLINFSGIEMGEVSIPSADVYVILKSAALDIMTKDGILIKDFTDNFDQEGMKIKNIAIVDQNMQLVVETSNDFSGIKDAIETGLEDVVTNISDPEVQALAQDILDNLSDPEALSELVNDFNDLLTDPNTDPDTINEILDILNSSLEDVDIFDLLP